MSTISVKQVGDYVFMYAYPVAFGGAVLYSTTTFLGVSLSSLMNGSLAQWLNIFIGVCGVVSMFTWLNQDVPLLTNTVYDRGAVLTSKPM